MTEHFILKLNRSIGLILAIAGWIAFVAPTTFAQSVPTQNTPSPDTTRRPLSEPAGARDIAGTWQGTVQAVPALRIVLKISKTDSESLRALMYSIDRGALSIPITAVTVHGATIKYLVPGYEGGYEGTLSPDGNSIAGIWKVADQSLPLTFMRTTPETAWPIPRSPASPPPMAADANPSFDVATIKPSAPGTGRKNFVAKGRHFSASNVTLLDLIEFAYGLREQQVLDAPDWAKQAKYDIAAEPDTEGQPSDEQRQHMYQKLLADRFKLTVHRDKQQFSVYALVAENGEPRLTRSSADPQSRSGTFSNLGLHGGWLLTFYNVSMADFVSFLMQAIPDRLVVDQTGLTGKFDFPLTFALDPLGKDAGAAPDIFQAVQSQLGLKLESTKALADVIVIDHIEPPSEN
jgi:uncharacterized protein (TIGR03435 family)